MRPSDPAVRSTAGAADNIGKSYKRAPLQQDQLVASAAASESARRGCEPYNRLRFGTMLASAQLRWSQPPNGLDQMLVSALGEWVGGVDTTGRSRGSGTSA